jgi:hypothetical protein
MPHGYIRIPPSRKRTRTKCALDGCQRMVHRTCRFCSKSCGMKYTRSQQTPERRQQIGRQARAGQRD